MYPPERVKAEPGKNRRIPVRRDEEKQGQENDPTERHRFHDEAWSEAYQQGTSHRPRERFGGRRESRDEPPRTACEHVVLESTEGVLREPVPLPVRRHPSLAEPVLVPLHHGIDDRVHGGEYGRDDHCKYGVHDEQQREDDEPAEPFRDQRHDLHRDAFAEAARLVHELLSQIGGVSIPKFQVGERQVPGKQVDRHPGVLIPHEDHHRPHSQGP